MKRRDTLAGALGVAAVLALSACGKGTSDLSAVTGESFEPIRYRITAEIVTPAGVKTGHSVWEYRGSMGGSIFGSQASSGFRVRGEAVAVDVAPGETLFVLMRTPNDNDYPANVLNAIPFERDTGPSPDSREEQMARTRDMYDRIRDDYGTHPLWRPKGQPRDETLGGVPYFVRFGDLRDPKSVEMIDPDHLDKSFGKGFRLKALTIEITDDPVTVGIEKRLGWLGKHPEPKLNPEHGPDDWSISAVLQHGDFSKGVTK